MNFLFKFLLSFKKFKTIVVLKNENSDILELISVVLKGHAKNERITLPLKKKEIPLFLKNDILVFKIDFHDNQKLKHLNFLIKKSVSSILILEKELTDEELKKIDFLFRKNGNKKTVIVDSKNIRKVNFESIDIFKIGFDTESNLQVSDLNITENTNFKVSHDGNVVPFWFNNPLDQRQLKTILFVIAAGMKMGLNLVEISQNLKQ